MYQVSPEDQLQVVHRQQMEWREASAGEHMDRTPRAKAPSRRTRAVAAAAMISHRLVAHADQLRHALAHALTPRHGTRGPRPTH